MTSSKSHLVFFDWDSTFASKIRDKEISVLNENVLKTLGVVYKVLKDFMRFRGSLHALLTPGVKFALGWTHFGLLRNLSYYLHVTSGVKFHPGLKDRGDISTAGEVSCF